MKLDDVAHEREANAEPVRAARARGVGLAQSVEDVRQEFRRDAASIVGDREQDGFIAALELDANFAADVLWGTPKGQVVDGTNELLGIHRRLMTQSAAPPARFDRTDAGTSVSTVRKRLGAT